MKWIFIFLIVIITLAYTIPLEIKRRKELGKYWSRSCTGRSWAREFPDATTEEIRMFLTHFGHAFFLKEKQLLKFSPDDKIMDIYRAYYPDKYMPDALELETLTKNIKEKYNKNLTKFWHDEITLGNIFEETEKEA